MHFVVLEVGETDSVVRYLAQLSVQYSLKKLLMQNFMAAS
jgi:hypothetical protein